VRAFESDAFLESLELSLIRTVKPRKAGRAGRAGRKKVNRYGVPPFSPKIITCIGEENSQKNNAVEKLENMVNESLQAGWRPVGGISVSSVQ
jgi:hypothetical protein